MQVLEKTVLFGERLPGSIPESITGIAKSFSMFRRLKFLPSLVRPGPAAMTLKFTVLAISSKIEEYEGGTVEMENRMNTKTWKIMDHLPWSEMTRVADDQFNLKWGERQSGGMHQ